MSIEEDKKEKKSSKKWKFLLALLLIIVIGGIFSKFFMRIKHIESGYIGIKSSIGNPIDNSVDYNLKIVKGYIVFMPLYSEIIVYPTTIQTVLYDSIKINTSDGTEFVVKPRISYQLDESKALSLYKSSKQPISEFNNGYLKELVVHCYVIASGNFSSDSIVTNKNAFENQVNSILTSRISEIGLILKNANSNLQIPQNIKDIIGLRSLSLQNAILIEDKMREEYAKANIQRIKDSLLNSNLSNLSIQKMFIEKWDGKLLSTTIETPKFFKDTTN